MALRKYYNTRGGEPDLSKGLQDVLRRNGMQAHISPTNNGYQLIVLGHDSPAVAYNLTNQQVQKLTNWGSNYANETAYNTFASIVKNDFHTPQNFVSAHNAGGRVMMGLNGYRLGPGEGGHVPGPRPRLATIPFFSPWHKHGRGWGGDFVGWSPRNEGWHMRRIGDRVFFPNEGRMVPERPDRSLRPGELKAGGYGFYYKGQQREIPQGVLDDVVKDVRWKPLEAAPRPKGQGIPYSQEITSPVYFNADKWKNVLSSHGIVIDENEKKLTVQSSATRVDLSYDLTPEELKKLTANNLTGKNAVSIQERLDIINNVIKNDFATKVTKDMLETKDLVNIELKPEVKEVVEAKFIEQERLMAQQQLINAEKAAMRAESERIARDPRAIDGREIQAILGNKGWYQPEKNGREMVVGEIRVDKTSQGAYVMSAEINGRNVTHSISAEEYNKFIEVNDKTRLKMFNDIFLEVDIKSAHGARLYEDNVYLSQDGKQVIRQEDIDIARATSNNVDGAGLRDFNDKKGFYYERNNGREVDVRDIEVNKQSNGSYKMTAVINGQSITHEISQKEYDKFLAVDDYQRMKLFSKVFNDVDIKTRPGEGFNLGAAVLAGMVAAGEVATGVALVKHDHDRGPRPELYASKVENSVNNPKDLASANYASLAAENNSLEQEQEKGVGRGV